MTVPQTGAICLFAGQKGIKGWHYCDGKKFPTESFPDLYEVIGNKFGGDSTDFALPDLQEQEKLLTGLRYMISLEENRYAPDPIIGSVFLSATDAPPEGCAFCDGTVLNINLYQPLYSLMGSKFGGNGYSTFALPDLTEAEKSLPGVRYVICISGIFPVSD